MQRKDEDKNNEIIDIEDLFGGGVKRRTNRTPNGRGSPYNRPKKNVDGIKETALTFTDNLFKVQNDFTSLKIDDSKEKTSIQQILSNRK